jgi:hypothetical protein
MCEACIQIHEEHEIASEQLLTAQRELAQYEISQHDDSFLRLWGECHEKLRRLWKLREEMAAHPTIHVGESQAADG